MGSFSLGMGQVPRQKQLQKQTMELQEIRLPDLDIPPFQTTPEESARLIQRDHLYEIEIGRAKARSDQVSFAILGVVRALDKLLGFGSSYFFDPEAYARYSKGESHATHLNSASHAPPFPEAKQYAENIYDHERFGSISSSTRRAFLQHVREQVAGHMDLRPHQIVLCRNTTEAARIAALVSGVLTTGDIQREILFTDGVHISVLLNLLLDDDPGNADRRDRFSSWPTYYARRGQKYDPQKTKLGKGEFGMFSVKRQTLEQIKQELDECLDRYLDARDIGLIVIPHVLRETGAVLPIKEICDHIRKKYAFHHTYHLDCHQPFILVDGAQAEGTVPGFTLRFKEKAEDIESIDCDGYISSPHKTLHSDVLGLLYLRDYSELDGVNCRPGSMPMRSRLKMTLAHIKYLRDHDHLPPNRAVILDGMFDPSLGIKPNVRDHLDCADAAGYLAAQRGIIERENLEGEGYTCAHRARLKALFRHELREECRKHDVRIVLPRSPFPESPFIQSIRFPEVDGRKVVESLHDDVLWSWIGEEGSARVSFGLTNTEQEVRRAAWRIVEAGKRAG